MTEKTELLNSRSRIRMEKRKLARIRLKRRLLNDAFFFSFVSDSSDTAILTSDFSGAAAVIASSKDAKISGPFCEDAAATTTVSKVQKLVDRAAEMPQLISKQIEPKFLSIVVDLNFVVL